MTRKKALPVESTMYRADLERLHADLWLIAKLCGFASSELFREDKGRPRPERRSLIGALDKVVSTAAGWAGSLACVLRYSPDYVAQGRPALAANKPLVDVWSLPWMTVPLERYLSGGPDAFAPAPVAIPAPPPEPAFRPRCSKRASR